MQAYFRAKKNKEVQIVEKNIPDVRNYRVQNDRAKSELGVTFSGSIESILDDLDAHNIPPYDFDNDQYYNIRTFKKLFTY